MRSKKRSQKKRSKRNLKNKLDHIGEESKNNFFKAIQNALRFHDQNLEIWLLAVYYELEVNRSPFKARNIFHKAL